MKECNLFKRSFCSLRFLKIASFPKICNEIMYHSMLHGILSDIFFGVRQLNAKILSISQTIDTLCCEDKNFPRGKFKLFNSLLHSVYFVFPKSLFTIGDLFAVRYL